MGDFRWPAMSTLPYSSTEWPPGTRGVTRTTFSVPTCAGRPSGGRTSSRRTSAGRISGGANLSDANVKGARLNEARLDRANLVQADLTRATLFGASLARANLETANLSEADLSGAGTVLIDANLRYAHLSKAVLSKARLSGANLSNAYLGEANVRGTDLREVDLSKADLRGADLGGANISGANISEARLGRANLSEAELSSANLYAANLSGADLSKVRLDRANLVQADLSGGNLAGADLSYAQLVDTGADLTGCRIYGVSAWSLKLERAKQQNLIITPRNEPEITVDNIEVAQFVYLLLHNEKIRDVIDIVTSKAVLILGRFTDERKAVLDALRVELRNRNLLPILFDFTTPPSRDVTETIKTLASLARFVIADITDATEVRVELHNIVRDFTALPVQLILLRGHPEFVSLSHLTKFPWVLPIFEYDDREHLLASLDKSIVSPAEDAARKLRNCFF